MGDYNDPFMRNQNASVQARPKAQGRANVLQLKLVRSVSLIPRSPELQDSRFSLFCEVIAVVLARC